ncbi:MAG: hypothetical protein FWH21_00645 [Kiritimatiellaeota bacterium]|nr:hypothetical protein [Kiritimatiellota bacterium]
MKQTLTLVISVLFVTTSFPQEKGWSIPSIDKLGGIMVCYASDWTGRFYWDGSASLISGSSHLADAPEGSFPFKEIYKTLVPHLKLDMGESKETLSVIFDEWEDTDLPAFYLVDKDVMRKIMHGLCGKVMPLGEWSKQLFEERLRKHPLVPGDPPYLKAEEEVIGDKGEVIGDRLEVIGDKGEVIGERLEVIGDQLEVTGAGMEEELPSPVAARKTNRPSLLFYVGAGILVCVGAVLFFTRKR